MDTNKIKEIIEKALTGSEAMSAAVKVNIVLTLFLMDLKV